MKGFASIAASIAAAVAALGIAGLALSDRGGNPANSSGQNSSPGADGPPRKTERTDHEHDPERFDSLEGDLKKIATDLEKAAINWNRRRPTHESVHRLWNDWSGFSTSRISTLETGQIRQLAEWVTGEGSSQVSELHDYRQALIKIWASREPEIVRARLLGIAEQAGLMETEVKIWGDVFLDEISDDFHHFRVGHAMHDPQGAWEAFREDDSDPRMRQWTNANVTLPDLFREYAARAPEEAWSLALTAPGVAYAYGMLEGFADGAPSGQDWERRGSEFLDSLASRGIDVWIRGLRQIAERWTMEDPDAALDWFARVASVEEVYHSDDAFADHDADVRSIVPEDAGTLLRIDLLADMYGSHKDRSDEVIATLRHLASGGDDLLAARVVGQLIGNHLDPMNSALLELIPRIPSDDVRTALFLQAVRAVPTRRGDSLSTGGLEAPNPSLQAVRELAARLELSPAIRAEAEEAFRNVESAEWRALEEQESRRRDEDDPFCSR